MDFATWVAATKSMGGVPTTWPVADDAYGQPAARFTREAYASAQLSGVILGIEVTHDTTNGDYVYVLYPHVTGTPHTMTALESFENTVFTEGDDAADALGLPTLEGLSHGLKVLGMIGLGVATIGLIVYAGKIRP